MISKSISEPYGITFMPHKLKITFMPHACLYTVQQVSLNAHFLN